MLVVWLFLTLNLTVVEGAIGDAVARVHRNSASLSTDLKRSEFIWSQGQFYRQGSHLE
jgi:hypothetical protein